MLRQKLTRQAIVDSDQSVMGYSLIYNDDLSRYLDQSSDPISKTHQLFMGLSILSDGEVCGDLPPFLHLSRETLLNPEIFALLPEDAIIELDSSSLFDEGLYYATRLLKHAGFRIAVGDIFEEKLAKNFLMLADIVMLDTRNTPIDTLLEQIKFLEPFGVERFALNVNTPHDFQVCSELGFEYFQGYYLGRPEVISTEKTLH